MLVGSSRRRGDWGLQRRSCWQANEFSPAGDGGCACSSELECWEKDSNQVRRSYGLVDGAPAREDSTDGTDGRRCGEGERNETGLLWRKPPLESVSWLICTETSRENLEPGSHEDLEDEVRMIAASFAKIS